MNALKDCEVCAILPTNEPIFETDYWMVSLSSDQGYLGRCYVTTKEHRASLSDLTTEEWTDLRGVTQHLETAVRSAFGATLFNWGCLMNNAFQKSLALPHVHWHFRPRYDKAVTIDVTEFTDPAFAHHYDRDHTFQAPTDLLASIKSAIQVHLP